MFDRIRNVWKTVLQADTGEVLEREFTAYWDPEKVPTDQIAIASAAEAHMDDPQRRRFAPISAELVAV